MLSLYLNRLQRKQLFSKTTDRQTRKSKQDRFNALLAVFLFLLEKWPVQV